MDADLVDQSPGAVGDVLDHIVLARIVHGCEYADVAFHIERESVVLDAVLVQDLLRDDRVHAALSDLAQILVNDIGTAAGDIEIGFHKAGNKGRKAADLSSRAEAEQMAGLLVFTDLLCVLGGELSVVLSLVKIQRSVKITCKYFLHTSGSPFDLCTGFRLQNHP